MKAKIHKNEYLNFNPLYRENAENTLKSTWIEFRDSLANKKFSYDQTDKALETVFLQKYDELFKTCGQKMLSRTLKDVFSSYNVGRGTILTPTEPTPYSRFIPIAEYIKEDNRFSPPGVEWLYLVIGDTNEHIRCCSEKECRAKTGDRFGFCNFSLLPDYGNVLIVDLTKYANETYNEINSGLIISAESIKDKALYDVKASGNTSSINIKASTSKYSEQIKNAIEEWLLKTYSTMLSELIFVPVEDNQKKLEYTPFQTMAKYFEKQGFGGIIYKSTQYPHAKNIVLFDKNNANPIGDVYDYII